MEENNNNQQGGLQMELPQDVAQGQYANFAIITHSSSDFVLDFARILPGVPKAQIKSRVILAPEHAKRLLQALQENVMRYEAQFGKIQIPNQQPRAIADTAEVFLDGGFEPENFGANAREVFDDIHSIKILACGTSYYAALTAKYWLESIAKIPTDVEIASEYRYRDVIADPKQLIITISQSGETLDTMEALKYAKSLGHKHSLSICNVMESALPRESELVLYTRAGAEIGVASTKAFTTQLVVLFGLAVTLGKQRGLVSAEKAREYVEELRQLPGSIQHVLNLEPQIAAWAQKFAKKNSALFLGRGIHFPIALEGALKLKEITYIHAEAYPAGELKHGPLALVDENMPVVVIAPNDGLLDKVKANMQEVGARGGELFVFADLDSNFNATDGVHVIRAPRHVGVLSPIVHTIPVQLLSYHAALARGTDVDKPRNLAKSVTVE